jgi:hypothetical protein
MAKFNYYGRQIAKVLKNGKEIFVITGQWIGHSNYGKKYGTDRQRKIMLKQCQGEAIIGISFKVFWNLKGMTGEIITDENLLNTCKELEYKADL